MPRINPTLVRKLNLFELIPWLSGLVSANEAVGNFKVVKLFSLPVNEPTPPDAA